MRKNFNWTDEKEGLEELEKEDPSDCILDEELSKRLLKIHDYPVGLFVRGELPVKRATGCCAIKVKLHQLPESGSLKLHSGELAGQSLDHQRPCLWHRQRADAEAFERQEDIWHGVQDQDLCCPRGELQALRTHVPAARAVFCRLDAVEHAAEKKLSHRDRIISGLSV